MFCNRTTSETLSPGALEVRIARTPPCSPKAPNPRLRRRRHPPVAPAGRRTLRRPARFEGSRAKLGLGFIEFVAFEDPEGSDCSLGGFKDLEGSEQA